MDWRTGLSGWIVLTAALAALLIGSRPAASECYEYGESMHWVGAVDEFVIGNAIRVRGDHAFVGSGSQGVTFLDLADPRRPEIIGMIDTPGHVLDIDLQGDLLCLADAYSGFRVIDVADPDQPRTLGFLATPGKSLAVAMRGDHAYVCCTYCDDPGIYIVDISLPMDPILVGYFAPPSVVDRITIAGDLMLLSGSDELVVADISDPLVPTVLSVTPQAGTIQDVTVDGTTAYCALGLAGIRIVDISTPSAPIGLGTIAAGWFSYAAIGNGDIAYVGDSANGLTAVDVSDPSSAVILGRAAVSARALALHGDGGLIYTGSEAAGFHVFDVSLATTPEITGQVGVPGYYGWDVATREDVSLAYVGSGNGIAIVSLETHPQPVLLGSVATGRDATALVFYHGLIYASTGRGVDIFHVLNPSAPYLVSHIEGYVDFDDVLVFDDRLYVAQGGLAVYDVTHPSSPVYLDDYSYGIHACGLAEQDGLLYVAGSGGSLAVVALGDDPQRIGIVHTDGRVTDVDVHGNFAYLSGETRSLHVVDVSDPENPIVVGVADPPGRAKRIVYNRGVVYLACDDDGFVAIDVTIPDAPVVLGGIHGDLDARGIAVYGESVIVAAYGEGLVTAPVQCDGPVAVPAAAPASPVSLRGVHPNPFNPLTTIRVRCRAPGRIELGIYDLKGRRVADLAAGDLAAGDHEFSWNGRDARGRAMPTGTYLVRLRTDGGIESEKIALVR